MSTISPIQTSFAGGEISPRFHGDIGSDLYAKSLKRAENWEITPQGSAKLRGGTQFQKAIANVNGRLLPGILGSSRYLLRLTAGRLQVFDESAGEVSGIGFDVLPPGAWGSSEFIVGPQNMPNEGEQWVSPLADISPSITTEAVPVEAQGVYDFSFIVYYQSYQHLTLTVSFDGGVFPSVTETYTVAAKNTAQRGFTKRFTVPVGATAVHFTFEGSGTEYEAPPKVSIFETHLKTVMVSDDSSVKAPWTNLWSVRVVPLPDRDAILLLSPEFYPYLLEKRTSGWSFFEAPIPEAKLWSDENRKPVAGAVFQGRLWLGLDKMLRASKANDLFCFTPTGVWNSAGERVLDANNFPVVSPSDPLSIDLITEGTIQWIADKRKNLFVGTDKEEVKIASASGLISSGDLQAGSLDSSFGSGARAALHIATHIAYASADLRKLRVLQYSRDTDSWESIDLTFFAEHMTASGIKEMHYIPIHGLIVLVLENGTMACCTFEPGKITAWWRFTVDGSIKSAAALGSTLWLEVVRKNGRAIESFNPFSDTMNFDCQFLAELDVVAEGVVNYVNIPTLLNGEMVAAVSSDGSVITPGVQVATDASISMSLDAFAEDPVETDVFIGVPFPGTDLIPLAPGSPTAKTRYSKIVLRVYDSALPLIKGRRAAPERRPETPLGNSAPRITGDTETRDIGFDEMVISQDLPVRTEILGIFGVAQTNRI